MCLLVNTSSNVVDLTTTSSVFPGDDNKLESQDWLRGGGIRLRFLEETN